MKSNSFRVAAAAAISLCATNAAAQDACGPFELLSDPAGDWSGTVGGLAGMGAGLPEQDLLSLAIQQSGSGDGALLTFRIATAGAPAAAPLPNAAWFTSFETPDGVVFGVRLQTDPTGAESFFSYIGGANNAGGVDGRFVEAGTEKPAEAGEFGADGVISITVKASNIGITGAGQTLGPFNAASLQSVPEGVVAFTVDEAPTGLGRDGFFDVQGSCAGKSSGLLGAGALPVLTLLPLLLTGLRRRWSRGR